VRRVSCVLESVNTQTSDRRKAARAAILLWKPERERAMLSCVLAEDNEGAWRMAFEPEERHLLPRDETHRRAIERLVELIGGALE
jgi:hypothetical protein